MASESCVTLLASMLALFCLPWNVTTACDVLHIRKEPHHVQAYPKKLHERAEGCDAEGASGRQGADLGHLRQAQASAEPVLRLAAATVRERRESARRAERRRGVEPREGARSAHRSARGEAGQEG